MTGPQRPTRDEIRAAVETLLQAWAPRTWEYRQRPVAADDYDDDAGNTCGCAGEDEDGQSLGCDCAGGCACPSCDHDRHAVMARCQVRDCGRSSAWEVVAWTTTTRSVCLDDDDPARTGDTTTSYDLDQHAYDCWSRSACGTAHVRDLIEADRAHRTRQPLSYRVEPYRYVPDHTDLDRKFGEATTDGLLIVRNAVRSLRYSAEDLTVSRWHGSRRGGGRLESVESDPSWLGLHREAAVLVDALLRLDPEILQRGLVEDGDE